jgi:hypothetical protein
MKMIKTKLSDGTPIEFPEGAISPPDAHELAALKKINKQIAQAKRLGIPLHRLIPVN